MRIIIAVVLTMGLMPQAARALTQSDHQKLTRAACQEAALPSAFCRRVAASAYNVDAYEFDDLAAHAQRADDQTLCHAADAVQERVRSLGSRLRARVEQMAMARDPSITEEIADLLGRALHTVHDNCVHAGVGNPQHAFASLADTCEDTAISPDLAPGGLACATEETTAALDAFKWLLDRNGLSGAVLYEVGSVWTHWPSRGSVCAYLDQAYAWDGTDVRWNPEVMIPQVRDQLAYALMVDDAWLGGACDLDPARIDPPAVDAPVDVDDVELDWCFTVRLYCVGKADASPPWEPPAGSAPAAGAEGCATTGSSGGAWLVLAGLLLAWVRTRRRTRS